MRESCAALSGKSDAGRAPALYQEALDTLDLALASTGMRRILLINTVVDLRQRARDLEAMQGLTTDGARGTQPTR